MRRLLRNRLLLGVVAASLLLLCAVGGCAAFSILMIKITGRGCIYYFDEPKYTFGLKGNQKIAVVCRSITANQYETQNEPRDIARQVGEYIGSHTGNKKLKVIESTIIDAWFDSGGNVFNDFLEVGRDESIAADYVIGIELLDFQLHDSHSPHLLQGKAKLQVRAFDCKSGAVVANESIGIIYPPTVPITAGPGIDQAFRTQFIQVVSKQVAIRFFIALDRLDDTVNELHRL